MLEDQICVQNILQPSQCTSSCVDPVVIFFWYWWNDFRSDIDFFSDQIAQTLPRQHSFADETHVQDTIYKAVNTDSRTQLSFPQSILAWRLAPPCWCPHPCYSRSAGRHFSQRTDLGQSFDTTDSKLANTSRCSMGYDRTLDSVSSHPGDLSRHWWMMEDRP